MDTVEAERRRVGVEAARLFIESMIRQDTMMGTEEQGASPDWDRCAGKASAYRQIMFFCGITSDGDSDTPDECLARELLGKYSELRVTGRPHYDRKIAEFLAPIGDAWMSESI